MWPIRKIKHERFDSWTSDPAVSYDAGDAVGLDSDSASSTYGNAHPFQPGDCFIGFADGKSCNETQIPVMSEMELCLPITGGGLDLATIPHLPKNDVYVNATGPRTFELGAAGPDTIGSVVQVKDAKNAWVRIYTQAELAQI